MNVENCDHLELEQACVFLNTNYQDENATLYSLSSDCMLVSTGLQRKKKVDT